MNRQTRPIGAREWTSIESSIARGPECGCPGMIRQSGRASMTAAFARHTLPLWLLLRNGRRLDRIQEWIGPVLPVARRSGAVPGLAEPDFEPRPVADSNSAIASKDPGHLGLKRRRRSAQGMVWSSARARVEHCARGDERTGESRMPRRGTPFQRQNETGHGRLLIAVDDRVVAATRLDFVSLSGADFDFAERTVQGRIGRRVANVVLPAHFARDLVEGGFPCIHLFSNTNAPPAGFVGQFFSLRVA